MLGTSYEPINLHMGFDLFDLLLTFGAYSTQKACPKPCWSPFSEIVFFLGYVYGQLGWTPWGKGFLQFLVIWLSPSTLG